LGWGKKSAEILNVAFRAPKKALLGPVVWLQQVPAKPGDYQHAGGGLLTCWWSRAVAVCCLCPWPSGDAAN